MTSNGGPEGNYTYFDGMRSGGSWTWYASSGDLINAIDSCTGGSFCEEATNLSNNTIRIATCEGTRLWLGNKNKLSSVSYGGGDAGGGNATVTYIYSTFNDFTVLHAADQLARGGSNWWASREDYLSINK